MRILLNKKTDCGNDFDKIQICDNQIREKLENLINADTPKLKEGTFNHHISIKHEANNHQIWIFLYDKNGVHESESRGKIIKQNAENIVKFPKTMKESDFAKILD